MTYLPRLLDRQIEHRLATAPVLVVDGPRASGKTTTASRFAGEQVRLPRDLDVLESNLDSLLTRATRPLLIDEWQLAGTDLLWAIKDIVDADPRPGQFILTGSVEPESYGPTYPLTGRSSRVMMRPLTQRELNGDGYAPTWISRLLDGSLFVPRADVPVCEIDRMWRTGFPGAPTTATAEWLRDYATTVAERSVDSRRDPVRVGRYLRALAELDGQVVPAERLWTLADIDRVTMVAYASMLERAHITTDSAAWSTNRIQRMVSQPKRLLVDAALSLALAGRSLDDVVRDASATGRYLESFVAAQLRPEVDAHDGALYHLRTQGGANEVDLIVETPSTLIAVEVKAGVRPRPADAKHLRWFRERVGDRLSAGVLLHRGSQAFEIDERIWAIPISTFWTG